MRDLILLLVIGSIVVYLQSEYGYFISRHDLEAPTSKFEITLKDGTVIANNRVTLKVGDRIIPNLIVTDNKDLYPWYELHVSGAIPYRIDEPQDCVFDDGTSIEIWMKSCNPMTFLRSGKYIMRATVHDASGNVESATPVEIIVEK